MSKTIHLSIPGMKCNGCVNAVEQALNNEAGVNQVSVDLESNRAEVESDSPVAVLVAAIKTAGFDAEEVTT